MRSDYKHWINYPVVNRPVFTTSTCLNFAHCFAEPHLRDIMAGSLLDDLRAYGAILDAFVVMSHHFHLVARPPEDKTASWLSDRVKSNSARRILPHLSQRVRAQLAEQQGLNERVMWMRGFRGLVLETHRGYAQKIRYTHRNPVDAGYVTEAKDYRWSSAAMSAEGLWTPERGFPVTAELVRSYCDLALLDLAAIRKAEVERTASIPPPALPGGG